MSIFVNKHFSTFKLFKTVVICRNKNVLSRSINNLRIHDLIRSNHVDASVKIKGWVFSSRSHKNISFIGVSDGSSHSNIQVVIPETCMKSLQDLPSYGCSVEVEGVLKRSKGAAQNVEIVADKVEVVGKCDPMEYPFKLKKRHPPDYVRQFLHLRPKTNTFSSLLRVRNEITQAMHSYFQTNGFIEVQTPILTANDCEGAGEVFQVEPANPLTDDPSSESDAEKPKHFFNTPTFLTVSGQLHLEVVNGAISRVYTFSPTFRAENQQSRHHLSEFYMVEAELAFTQSIDDVINDIENLLTYTTTRILDRCEENISFYMKNVAPDDYIDMVYKIANGKYIRMDYKEAIDILQWNKDGFSNTPKYGCDLKKEHEKFLVDYCDNVPVFVFNFPKELKPFYARVNDDDKTAASVDLLYPGIGEVVGGTLREERYDILHSKLQQLSLLDNLNWYLDIRKYGSVPHGGYGLGLERYVQAVLGISNIKDSLIFPRYTHHCKM